MTDVLLPPVTLDAVEELRQRFAEYEREVADFLSELADEYEWEEGERFYKRAVDLGWEPPLETFRVSAGITLTVEFDVHCVKADVESEASRLAQEAGDCAYVNGAFTVVDVSVGDVDVLP